MRLNVSGLLFDKFLFFDEQGSIVGHSHFGSIFGQLMGTVLCFDEHWTGSTSQLTGFFDFFAHSLNGNFEIRVWDPEASELLLLLFTRGLEGTTITGGLHLHLHLHFHFD